ncbi:ROK family protein [Microbacterium karelineae]|uniref:ROK family protein n=1 Tax=Microbacterium karelineae TaxID=2654283 RepID=UPI0012E9F76D|nr:ROK family protein [Microbacterium karelineae]
MTDARRNRPHLTVGVDLGGTKVAAAAVLPDGVGPVHSASTPAQDGPDAVIHTIVSLVARIAAEHEGADLTTVGIGAAGSIDPVSGVVVASTASFADWVGTRLTDEVRAALRPLFGDVRVGAVNDVTAHALGEASARGCGATASMLVIAVGTGVGGALLLAGRPLIGARNAAGEIGHIPVSEAEDLTCSCGLRGHLEAIGSGPGLRALHLSRGGDPGAVDARAIVRLAADGDRLAAESIAISARAIGRAIAGLVVATDPAAVVVSGGLAASDGLWWDVVHDTVRAILPAPFQDLDVLRSELGPRAAMVGAALWATRSRQEER